MPAQRGNRTMSKAPRWARKLARTSTTVLLLLASILSALADSWPQRPVKFIVTLGPGSGVDFGARLLADRLSKRWGQPVVVENRPGGDAVVAVNAVISANDDHMADSSGRRNTVFVGR